MFQIDEAREQLAHDISATKDLIEGFRDLNGALAREGNSEATRELDRLLNSLTERNNLQEAALDALTRLTKNGYPTDVPLQVSADVAKVLGEQVRTQELAFGSITVPADAATATVAVGPPVPKP